MTTEDHGRTRIPHDARPHPDDHADGEMYLLDDDWAGRDYLDRFTDRCVLSRRRGDRPPRT